MLVFVALLAASALACHPECRWQCDDPVCAAECSPVCREPVCEVVCDDGASCGAPKCSVRCGGGDAEQCEADSCPNCETVCDPPRCPASAGECSILCEPPVCEWQCRKPRNCPRPRCELQCEAPACQSTSVPASARSLAPSLTLALALLVSGQ